MTTGTDNPLDLASGWIRSRGDGFWLALLAVIGLFILYSVWLPKPRGARLADRAFYPLGALISFAGMFVGAYVMGRWFS